MSGLARQQGLGARLEGAVRTGEQGRLAKATPIVAIVDSQTTKTVLEGISRYGEGKKMEGRKG